MVYDNNDGPIYSMLNGKVSCQNNGDCSGIPYCSCFYEKSYFTQPWDPPTSCPSGFVSTPDTDANDNYCVFCAAHVEIDCNLSCPSTYNGVSSKWGDEPTFQGTQICCDGFCTKGVDANGAPSMIDCP
jgi:hypothetical protein